MIEYRLEYLDPTATWETLATYDTRDEAQQAFDEYVTDDPQSFEKTRIRPAQQTIYK